MSVNITGECRRTLVPKAINDLSHSHWHHAVQFGLELQSECGELG